MPNTRSAKKRLRQNVVRRSRNRSNKSSLRTQLRKVTEALSAGNVAQAEAEFRLAQTKLDQAAAGNLIHGNAAARLKSRLNARIRAAKKPAATKS